MDIARSTALHTAIREALREKMVFIGGARQVGKTTLSLSFLPAHTKPHPAYFNWDHAPSAARLRALDLPPSEPLLVLDEIHKYARWRNLVKGIYDSEKSFRNIIVTGSARLDYYRKGGDSLVGRYRYFRLHPISLLELNPTSPSLTDLERLLQFSGFPEPLAKGDETHWRLWQRDRLTQVVREDLRDLETVREITLVELLLDLLPDKVGSPLSIKSVREVVGIDHKTAERWIEVLERLYVCYRISPYGAPRIRAVKKERKLYFWDWTMVPHRGPRFENLVASQLLKYCHWIEDTQGHRMELRFLRDTDKREVDFVVIKDGHPVFAVECKTGEKSLSPAIPYFAERTPIPAFYQVHLGTRRFATGKATLLPFVDFCRETGMP